MKQFHLHPDKRIFLREDDEILFEGTIEETEAVIGKLPPVPDGVREIQFDLDSKTLAAFGKKGQIDNVVWDFSLTAAKFKKLKEAGAARIAALADAATPKNEVEVED